MRLTSHHILHKLTSWNTFKNMLQQQWRQTAQNLCYTSKLPWQQRTLLASSVILVQFICNMFELKVSQFGWQSKSERLVSVVVSDTSTSTDQLRCRMLLKFSLCPSVLAAHKQCWRDSHFLIYMKVYPLIFLMCQSEICLTNGEVTKSVTINAY